MKKVLLLVFVLAFVCVFAAAANAADIWEVDFANNNPPSGVSSFADYCWDMGDHLVFYSRDSQLTLRFDINVKTYGDYNLIVTDRASAVRMYMEDFGTMGIYSPYTIKVNNSTVADNIDIMWLQDKVSTYSIGKYLKQGKNIITFTLNPGSNTRYEIRRVQLTGVQ